MLELSRELSRNKQTRSAGPVVEAPRSGRRGLAAIALALAIAAGVYGARHSAPTDLVAGVQSSAIAIRDKIAAWSRGWLDFGHPDDEASARPAPQKQQL